MTMTSALYTIDGMGGNWTELNIYKTKSQLSNLVKTCVMWKKK